jgi:hypothetical protein
MDYVESNALCKRQGCCAVKIGPSGHCERHEPMTPWGETYYEFAQRISSRGEN